MNRRQSVSVLFRLVALLSVVTMLVVARTSHALPHLKLLRSFPAADTVLATSPDAIKLWLSEPTEAPVSKITIANASGVAAVVAAATRDAGKDAPLVAKITKPLANGAYTVTWKAMSHDGHVVNGTFAFRVGAAK